MVTEESNLAGVNDGSVFFRVGRINSVPLQVAFMSCIELTVVNCKMSSIIICIGEQADEGLSSHYRETRFGETLCLPSDKHAKLFARDLHVTIPNRTKRFFHQGLDLHMFRRGIAECQTSPNPCRTMTTMTLFATPWVPRDHSSADFAEKFPPRFATFPTSAECPPALLFHPENPMQALLSIGYWDIRLSM
jgi:hypothetical protein